MPERFHLTRDNGITDLWTVLDSEGDPIFNFKVNSRTGFRSEPHRVAKVMLEEFGYPDSIVVTGKPLLKGNKSFYYHIQFSSTSRTWDVRRGDKIVDSFLSIKEAAIWCRLHGYKVHSFND